MGRTGAAAAAREEGHNESNGNDCKGIVVPPKCGDGLDVHGQHRSIRFDGVCGPPRVCFVSKSELFYNGVVCVCGV